MAEIAIDAPASKVANYALSHIYDGDYLQSVLMRRSPEITRAAKEL